MTTTHIEPKLVPSHLRAGYAGRHFTAEACATVTIPASAGLWDGGSRDTYHVVRLSDGSQIAASDQMLSPWDDKRRGRVITLEPGVAVVRHSMLCGKDMGLRFYLHPSDIVQMIAPPLELTDVERLILVATRSYKASYGGMDRYTMARHDFRYADRPYPSREEWNTAKLALIGRKLLNRAGAITVIGRNAVEGFRP